MKRLLIAFISLWLAAPALAREEPPPLALPELTAPSAAPLGPYAVGVKRLILDGASVAGQKTKRQLPALIWYPAPKGGEGPGESYSATLHGDKATIDVTVRGIAQNGLVPAAGPFPLVILSHGFGGNPAFMAWIGENLASKGYVAAALDHGDGAVSATTFAGAVLYRAPDIAGAAAALVKLNAKGQALAGLVDSTRIAVIGYSMGGYGSLRVAGIRFNPVGKTMGFVPGGALKPLTEGKGPMIPGLKAAIAIAPWGGQSDMAAFDLASATDVKLPVLFLAAARDRVSGWEDGVKNLYGALPPGNRRLMLFEQAGHSLGMPRAPLGARARMEAFAFFEDSVWRKERLAAISQHLITLFLDAELKGLADAKALLAIPNGPSGDLPWPGFTARWQDGLTHFGPEAPAAGGQSRP